jgi:serine/threonine-protein kinase RsbW
MTESLTIPAELTALDRARGFLKDGLGTSALSEDDRFQLDLALVEIIVNIVRYGYPAGAGEIRLSIDVGPNEVRLEFRDRGIPFDPRSAPEPALEKLMSGGRRGGLGIHLVRKFTDDMSYRRDGEENVLSLRKSVHR